MLHKWYISLQGMFYLFASHPTQRRDFLHSIHAKSGVCQRIKETEKNCEPAKTLRLDTHNTMQQQITFNHATQPTNGYVAKL